MRLSHAINKSSGAGWDWMGLDEKVAPVGDWMGLAGGVVVVTVLMLVICELSQTHLIGEDRMMSLVGVVQRARAVGCKVRCKFVCGAVLRGWEAKRREVGGIASGYV